VTHDLSETHCNTLQHTATHCNTLQHTATHGNTRQHTATHCNTLQHTGSGEEDGFSEENGLSIIWSAKIFSIGLFSNMYVSFGVYTSGRTQRGSDSGKEDGVGG